MDTLMSPTDSEIREPQSTRENTSRPRSSVPNQCVAFGDWSESITFTLIGSNGAMIAIGIVAIPAYARLTRGQVLAVRAREFIVAARTIGCSPLRIVMRHIFPNVMNALIVQATLSTAFAILAEAALSFLGLGPQPPFPSWGQDINYSQRYLPNLKWWMSVGPGLAIFSAVFAFNFLGDALRDALDPRLRRSA